jgi:hypothetical protein
MMTPHIDVAPAIKAVKEMQNGNIFAELSIGGVGF